MKPEGENFIMRVKMMVMKYQVRKNGRGSGKFCQNNISYCQITGTLETNCVQHFPVSES